MGFGVGYGGEGGKIDYREGGILYDFVYIFWMYGSGGGNG